MDNHIIYKSKPFYFWLVTTLFATVFIAFISNSNDYKRTLTSIFPAIVGVIISILLLNRFVFYELYYERKHLFFILLNKKHEYSAIHRVEILKRKEPRTWPSVLFHSSSKSSKFSPSFTFNKSEELIPLLDCLIKHNVLIILNYTSDYWQEREFLKDYIENKGGNYELTDR